LTTTYGPGSSITTTARWIGDAARPLLAWLTRSTVDAPRAGALIVPPVGYEYMTTHRTLRVLAETLASHGCDALRFDYDGTGDSAGDQWDPKRLAAWEESVRHGADELRRIGNDTILVIGLRFGATLALLEAANVDAARVVAWDPVISGRRFVRQLRMLGVEGETAVSVGGFVFDAETIDDISAIDLTRLDSRPAPSVLLIERAERPGLGPLAEQLRTLGSEVTVASVTGSELCLDGPTEYAEVPEEIVTLIAASSTDTLRNDVPAETTAVQPVGDACAELDWHGVTIREYVTTFTDNQLVGVVGERASSIEPRATVVWLNSGSESHIGPGRAWVEYSRTLNALDVRTIRLDCRGWGESPDDGYAPGRPYDAHMTGDVRALVDDLERRGWKRAVIAGLCAGAWIALEAARTTPLAGVIALNPQLYWEPGDPIEANILTETHVRREGERQRIKDYNRYGVWSILDVLGIKNRALQTLSDIDSRGTRTLLLFAPRDDGLEFLEDRSGRALQRVCRGSIEVFEMETVDHGMHRAWQRPEVVEAVVAFVEKIAPSGRREDPTGTGPDLPMLDDGVAN
jgi:alpha-beta hydrolase superfamily lysophospholipase